MAVVVGGVGLAGRGAEEGVVDAFEVFDADVGVFALGVQGRVDGATEFGRAGEARDGVGGGSTWCTRLSRRSRRGIARDIGHS